MKNLTLILALTLTVGSLGLPAFGEDDAKQAEEPKRCSADLSECVHKLKTELSGRGWIGIEWNSESGDQVLTQVVSNSPAEEAGLAIGDVILAFNGVSTKTGDEAMYKEVKKSLVPGNKVRLTVRRAGEVLTLPVTLAPLPRHVMAQWIGNHVLEHHVVEDEEDSEAPRP